MFGAIVMCQWVSVSPGMSTRPRPSITVLFGGAVIAPEETCLILRSEIRTFHLCECRDYITSKFMMEATRFIILLEHPHLVSPKGARIVLAHKPVRNIAIKVHIPSGDITQFFIKRYGVCLSLKH